MDATAATSEAVKTVGPDNEFLLFKVFLDKVAAESVKELKPRWINRLAGVDVWLESHVRKRKRHRRPPSKDSCRTKGTHDRSIGSAQFSDIAAAVVGNPDVSTVEHNAVRTTADVERSESAAVARAQLSNIVSLLIRNPNVNSVKSDASWMSSDTEGSQIHSIAGAQFCNGVANVAPWPIQVVDLTGVAFRN